MDAQRFLGLLAQTRPDTGKSGSLGKATPTYCRTRLLTVTTVDAATAVVARATVRSGAPLSPVVDAWTVRTPNPITRARHREQGKALLELAGLEPTPLPRAVAMGVLAARADFEPEDLARLVGFDDVQGVIAAAHPADVRAWSAALVKDVRAMAAQVAHLVDPDRIPATGADLLALAP